MGEMPFHLELIKLNSWWESIFLLWLSCRHFFQFSCHKVSDAVVGGKRITQYQDQGCWSCQEIKPKAMLMNIEYTLSLLWKCSATSDNYNTNITPTTLLLSQNLPVMIKVELPWAFVSCRPARIVRRLIERKHLNKDIFVTELLHFETLVIETPE